MNQIKLTIWTIYGNMDHISGNGPSLISDPSPNKVVSKDKKFDPKVPNKLNSDPSPNKVVSKVENVDPKVPKQVEAIQKGWCHKPTKLQFQSFLYGKC